MKKKPKVYTWRDLKEFATPSNSSEGWNQPFPHEVRPFPEKSNRRIQKIQHTNESQATQISLNIPTHLPPFPPAHTYKKKQSGLKRKNVESTESRNKRLETSRSLKETVAKIEDIVDQIQS